MKIKFNDASPINNRGIATLLLAATLAWLGANYAAYRALRGHGHQLVADMQNLAHAGPLLIERGNGRLGYITGGGDRYAAKN